MTFHEDLHDLTERVIRVAFQAGYNAGAADRAPNAVHMGCPDRYTDWRERGPGALFPFGKGPQAAPVVKPVKSPKETEAYRVLQQLDGLDGDPEVCTTHLVFVPCRHGGGYQTCSFSTDVRHVAVVGQYQRSEIGAARAHAVIKAYPAVEKRERH